MKGSDRDVKSAVGACLLAQRQVRRLSQDAMARLLDLGSNNYAALEKGRTEPMAGTIAKVCRALGITADSMLGLETMRTTQGLRDALIEAHERARLGEPGAEQEVRRLTRALADKYAADEAAMVPKEAPPAPTPAVVVERRPARAASALKRRR